MPMNILKIIFAVMLIFDVTYMFIYVGSELFTTIRDKLRKKKKTEATPDDFTFDDDDEYEDEDEDEDEYSSAPPLCIDSIRLVHSYDVKELITDRIFRLSKEITDQLSEEDKEQVIRLLSAFIMYLHDEAPTYEQNFTVVMELLNASTAIYDPENRDPVDRLMDDCLPIKRSVPGYYLDYQKYRISCENKAHILLVSKVLVLTVLKKLYVEWYCYNHNLYNTQSVKELLRNAKWDVPDIDTEDM